MMLARFVCVFAALVVCAESYGSTTCGSLFSKEAASQPLTGSRRKFKDSADLRAFSLGGLGRPYMEALKLNGLEFISEAPFQNDPANGFSVMVRYLGVDISFTSPPDRKLTPLATRAIEGAIRAIEMTQNPGLVPSDATATAKFHDPKILLKLPKGVQRWLRTEQKNLSRDVDTKLTRGFSPTRNFQEEAFKPETASVFELEGHWISEDKLDMVTGAPSVLTGKFERKRNGRKEYLLLVHPESRKFYADLIKFSRGKETFLATPTASSRSVVAWKEGDESAPFVAKLSLDRQIGNIVRTIDDKEIAKSMGVDMVIAGSSSEFPENVTFIREVAGFMPKGATMGGYMIRELPKEMMERDTTLIPFFALYGTSSPDQTPLLVTMLKKSGRRANEFVENEIVRPFARMWVQMAIKNRFVFEPHAQNALREIDSDGMLTKELFVRDNGGYTFDFDARKRAGLYVPRKLPTLGQSFDDVYDPSKHASHYFDSLVKYYEGGFLSQLEVKTTEWASQGLIPEGLERGWSRGILRDEIEREIFRLMGQRVSLNPDFSNLNLVMSRLSQAN